METPKPGSKINGATVLLSSITQSGIFSTIIMKDGTVVNDVPMCYGDFEMEEIKPKFELFDTIRHTKIKEREGQIRSITNYGNTITYYCGDYEINENYAEKVEEKKVGFNI